MAFDDSRSWRRRLQLMTWPQVETCLAESKGIVVPIGATEQHGPSGAIGTDALCAESLAWGVGAACDAVVAPTLAYGMSQHHLGFAGSVTLLPSTLLLVVRDVVLSLARHGFRRLYFVNGHGGNTPTLHAAFSELYALAPGLGYADLRCRVASWWETEAAKRLLPELFGDREGDHATPGELSLVMASYPELAANRTPAGLGAPSVPFYTAADFRQRFPDGRMGSDPALASAANGERIRAEVVADLAAAYRAFLAES